ncbi:MAG TPA: type II toxin-antitoxin system RelE/ParE family toxin [Planctomycetota bacterium]|jgi:mRNA interferase RelE/StbE
MEKYRLVFRKSVAKDLRHIADRDVRQILAAINTLSANPRRLGCEKLSGQERYRLRQGDYRILYEIRDEEPAVEIVKVAHRREVNR